MVSGGGGIISQVVLVARNAPKMLSLKMEGSAAKDPEHSDNTVHFLLHVLLDYHLKETSLLGVHRAWKGSHNM